jgi:hypothetical protein
VPINIKHALRCKYVAAWQNAIRSELVSLYSKETLCVENKSFERNAMGKTWVVKVATKPNGFVDRFKARLVAHGFNQRAGVD